jgi:carbon monoxide dehydrogenase subunit G
LILDPTIMAKCVPGTQNVQIVSDTEYLAEIKVKISFISAKFKVRTKILKTRPPTYLQCEGTGEDTAVASSMKQTSELFLTDLGDGSTEIHVKAKADVLGRLGTFGLSVMRTKVDRMWDEFGEKFRAVAVPRASA